MFKMKKLLASVLVVTMLASIGTNVFASSSSNNDSYWVNGQQVNEGTIEIKPSEKRIDSKGEFGFTVSWTTTSTKFTVDDTQTTISVSANIVNPAGYNVNQLYPDHEYSIVLFEDGGLFHKKVGMGTFYADGDTYEFTTTGLDKSETYYFKVNNGAKLPGGTYVVGSGSVSNYVHP